MLGKQHVSPLEPPDAATWTRRGRLRGASFGGLRASLTALPAWNRTALLAAILIVSPLCARQICRTGYADLPASAVESARRDILDTFGCMLGGSGSPEIDELFAVIARWGGREESRVPLRGTRRRRRLRC